MTADDIKRGKPDPPPFQRAMQALRTEPKACVVIENAPFGIQSARAAGCSVIAICSTLSREDLSEAHYLVNDHHELESLLFGDVLRSDESGFIEGDSQ